MRVVHRFTLCKELLRSKIHENRVKIALLFLAFFDAVKIVFQRKNYGLIFDLLVWSDSSRKGLAPWAKNVRIQYEKKHASHNKSYDDSVSNQRIQFTIHIQHGYNGTSIFPVITRLRNETYSHHKKHTQSKRGIHKKVNEKLTRRKISKMRHFCQSILFKRTFSSGWRISVILSQ